MQQLFIVESVHHIGLVVRNEQKARTFYTDILGFQPHHRVDSWLMLNDKLSIHLIEIPEAEIVDSLFHQINHVAIQVSDLKPILKLLLEHGQAPFQMDFEGAEKPLTDPEDPMNFGLGTIFVNDPDGNLIEFLQMGHGVFTEDTESIAYQTA
ncbi:MAG: VOC family protein [Candidatus Melainabacteria bacterium]|nr:VOC family protein [Candidatus Melainabacteria bacterium]